jgi:hypothetical protein
MTIVVIVCDQADLLTVGRVLCKAVERTLSVSVKKSIFSDHMPVTVP